MSFNLHSLSFRYPEHRFMTLDSISISVSPGSFVSIIGPNGSGKSTLLKVLCGILSPASGDILYQADPFIPMSPGRKARLISYVPQQHPLLFSMTVTELVSSGRAPYLNWWGTLTATDRQAVEQALELADIAHLKDQPVDQLSGGEQQRVWIARALAQETETIILDEPTAHLDIRHQIDVYNLLKKLQTDQQRTIILACHDLNLAARYSSHMLVLRCGLNYQFGSTGEVLTSDMIRDVFRIEAGVKETKAGYRVDIQPEPIS